MEFHLLMAVVIVSTWVRFQMILQSVRQGWTRFCRFVHTCHHKVWTCAFPPAQWSLIQVWLIGTFALSKRYEEKQHVQPRSDSWCQPKTKLMLWNHWHSLQQLSLHVPCELCKTCHMFRACVLTNMSYICVHTCFLINFALMRHKSIIPSLQELCWNIGVLRVMYHIHQNSGCCKFFMQSKAHRKYLCS